MVDRDKQYSEVYEALPQLFKVDLVTELWMTGMALSIIAKWPIWGLPGISKFNRDYVEAWVLRTASILAQCQEKQMAIEMLRVTSQFTKPNARLEKAAYILEGNPSIREILDLQFIKED